MCAARLIFIISMTVGLAAILDPPKVAVAQTTVFTAVVGNHWHSLHNWTHGIPNASLHAVIPPGETCVIYHTEGNASVASIEVQGTLIIDEATLTIARPGTESQTITQGPLLIRAGDRAGTVPVLLKTSRRHTVGDDVRHSRRDRKPHRQAGGRRR